MTLILEFNRKLIFYRPGILHYAMRQAGRQLGAPQSPAQRHQLLSKALKRGWAEAKAELAAFQRVQALASERGERFNQAEPQHAGGAGYDGQPVRTLMDVREAASPADVPPAALRQLH